MIQESSWIWFLFIVTFAFAVFAEPSTETYLSASFSQHGLKGQVEFTYHGIKMSTNETNSSLAISISIKSDLETESASYNWAVFDLPVEYTQSVVCEKDYLGDRVLDLTALLGQVTLPITDQLEFETSSVNLTGPNSLWGRTLVFDGPRTLCATIMPNGGLKIATAQLSAPIAGSVTVISWDNEGDVDTRIVTDLYHVTGDGIASNHVWKLFVTDVLDTKADRDRENCNALQLLYDPDGRSGEGCSSQQREKCKLGDLAGRLGLVRAASKPGRGFGGGSRRVFRDASLILPDLNGPRLLYVVLFDKNHPDSIYACGRFRELRPRKARALFAHKGARGEIVFEQRSPFDVTRVLVNLTGLSGLAGGFHVHEYPVPIAKSPNEPVCQATAKHYNPWEIDPSSSPPPGRGTGEMYELGDLSGKFGMLSGLNNLESDVVDTTLPLFGPFSIIGRGLVIHLASDGSRWICANVEAVGVKMTTAVATFHYPLGGRIIFRQVSDDPLSETMVYIESLIYSDGSVNSTVNHQLEVHNQVPDEDYHDWQQRCKSVGDIYNPFKVNDKSANSCSRETQRLCMTGDLARKHGVIEISGTTATVRSTQRLFIDINLPLSGMNSIVGRSLIIIDNNSPKQRGNRLACTPILNYPRHKAVVKDWFGNGFATKVEGKLEFLQETEFSSSFIQMDISGLGGEAGAYGIFTAPVKADLQFPCTKESLGQIFNPLNVSNSLSVMKDGTFDQYSIGDLSSKFGNLTGFTEVHSAFNDTNLPLYGPTSIAGRSFVLNRARDSEQWVCGTLGWGFSPAEAQEIRAIASFHHPGGFASGYVRMSQVVYYDGSSTDTVIEVNLKHPGKLNRNITRNHRWAVYVNPVGQDAAVASFTSRCVAAGFIWNPGFVQLTDPRNDEVYQRECKPHVPFRCMVGDLSGRLGNIDLGVGRYVLSDRNLPLSGKYSIMGRSIVLLTPNGGSDRFACANIQIDRDIFKFIVIRKPPKFSPSEFIEDVRRVLGVPEWMLQVDTRETRDIQNGRCVQFKVHFLGPYAGRIEQDLGQLLSKGELAAPSIEVPGSHLDPKRRKTIPYHVCDESDNDRRRTSSKADHLTSISGTILLILFSYFSFHLCR